METIGSIAIIVLGIASTALGQDNAPADQEVAARDRAGRRVPQGSANRTRVTGIEPAQDQHQLGMTALAGLALLENGMARESREIGKARELVAIAGKPNRIKPTTSRWRSSFWHDVRRGDGVTSDALIQSLGRRLAAGRSRWDLGLHCSSQRQTSRRSPWAIAARRGERARRANRRGFAGRRRNSNTQFALLGLWAAGRHGFDSDASSGIDRRALSVVAANRDGRWGYRVGDARVRGDVVRRD